MGVASSTGSARGGGMSRTRNRVTKTSLTLLWLLSSSEIFGCCKRIESTSAGMHRQGIHRHHHHHDREVGCHGAIGPGGAAVEGSPLSRSWKGLAEGMWKRPANSCTATDACDVLHRRGGHSGHAQGGKHGDMATFGLPLPLFKIILQLLLTGLNVVCWLVPMKIKRFRENQQLISLANAFSGGVFLSLAFGHMIPHAMDGFDAAGYARNVPFFVTLAGYLVIFFVEKIAFDTHSFIEEHHHHPHHHDNEKKPPAPAAPPAKLGNGNGGGSAVANSGRSAIVLLFALAVHAVFETMALGLTDTPLQAGLLAASIALHQPAESIALLVAFLKSGLSEAQTTRYLGIFSAIGTCGVFLGLAVSQLASELWESIFVALAAGTFVYVGCTEIVAEEFEEPEDRWKKFGALLLGVLGVGWLCVLTEGWEHH